MNRTLAAAVAGAALVVGACGGPSTSPTRATDASNGTTTARSAPAASSASATALASVAPSPSSIGGLYPVAGHDMWIACKGSGSPTVIFEAGLGSEGYVWWGVSESVSSTTRVCTYDRAGVGTSRQRPGNPPTSAGAMAREAWALFDAAGLTGPLILVGHSYGGMIVQLLAAAHPDRVRGAVLVDSSSRHQFEGDWLASEGDWIDNSSPVDRVASARELAGVKSLGAIPLVVLTQGQINGDFEIAWSRFQDELAALSSNSLHIVARDSGHEIMKDDPRLVVEAIRAAVASSVDGTRLPACGPLFVAVGGECLASTMTAQLAAWDAYRATVKPSAGKLPDGTYVATVTGAQKQAATGHPSDYRLAKFTWTLRDGHWRLSLVVDGAPPDTAGDVYNVSGDEVLVRIPFDWRIPRTPGVNRFRWSADRDGTLHFTQIDGLPAEESFTVPWIRTRN